MDDSLIFGEVGARAVSASLSQGGRNPARLGNMGDILATPLHGKYYEQAYQGKMFGVANQAAVTTTAALATTWTGLGIANPAGSGVNLVINRFAAVQFAVGAAGGIGLMTGAGACAGSLATRNMKTGGAVSPTTTASAGATIATPVLVEVYGSVGSLATTGYGAVPGIVVDLEGSLIITPGYFLASYTTVATTTSLIFSLVWEEVPI